MPRSKMGLWIGLLVLALVLTAAGFWINEYIKEKKLVAYYDDRFGGIAQQVIKQTEETREATSIDHLDEIITRTDILFFHPRVELLNEANRKGLNTGGWEKRLEDLAGQFQEIVESKGRELAISDRAEPNPPPQTITNAIGMNFVYIPPGTFVMGSPESEPGRYNDENQYEVDLTQGFYMQTTEVTQGQWQAVMGSNPSKFKACGKNCPVDSVSWWDAQRFIKKINAKETIVRYRLPTEAEWEYACRAGTQTAFSFGNDAERLSNFAWYAAISANRSHPVSRKKHNPWGLYDMHGNVWEWCQSWHDLYPQERTTDPSGPSDGSGRILRGGAWDTQSGACRSAYRLRDEPGVRDGRIGFRLVSYPGQ